jgi:hypothetical protein
MTDESLIRKMLRTSLVGMFCWLLANNAFAVEVPDDLAFRSLQVVNSANQSDMGWGGFQRIRTRDVLMITFDSEFDIRAISQHGEFTITPKVSACQRREIDTSRTMHSDVTVYDQSGNIEPMGDDGTSYLRVKQKHDTLYHIYVDLRFDGHGALDVLGRVPYNYDISQSIENLCVSIHGNNARGDEFETNIFMIE